MKLHQSFHFILIVCDHIIVLTISGLILGLRPANGRRRYTVKPPLTGWAQT